MNDPVAYCKDIWGWYDPTEAIITDAKVQFKKEKNGWKTGDFLRHLNIFTPNRLDIIIAEALKREGLFFENLINIARDSEKDILIDVRNKVLAFSFNIQCISEIGSQITIHPLMSNQSVADECAKMSAVLCIIQATTPIMVFSEHSSSFTDFSSLSGDAKKSNSIFLNLKTTVVQSGIAATPSMILDAKSLINIEDDDEIENIIKDFELKKDTDRAKLAAIHNEAIKLNATDIHIIPERNSNLIKVRIRVYKTMRDLPKSFWLNKREYFSVRDFLTAKSGASENNSSLKRTGDGRYTYMSESRKIEVRGAFVDKGTEQSVQNKLVTIRLRIIPQMIGNVDLDEIGVPTDVKQHMANSMRSNSGLVVVVGPTGSGKSTTLFGLVELSRQIHGDSISRLSIEDPIERFADGIDQVQIKKLPSDNAKDNLFLEYLRTYVRMDPDFVLLGEIRDAETAEMAAEQAVTGHKAVTTIHANNVVEALQRLLNMVETENLRQMVIDSMDHLFGQRLIPKICSCGEVHITTDDERKEINTFIKKHNLENVDVPNEIRHINQKGCKKCKYLGVTGVIPSHEVLVMSDEVKELALKADLVSFNRIKKLRTHTIESATLEHVRELNAPLSAIYAT